MSFPPPFDPNNPEHVARRARNLELRNQVEQLEVTLQKLRDSFDVLSQQMPHEKGQPSSPFRICEVPARMFSDFVSPETMVPVNIDWLLKHGFLPIRSQLIEILKESVVVRKKLMEAREPLEARSTRDPLIACWAETTEIRKAEEAIKGLSGIEV